MKALHKIIGIVTVMLLSVSCADLQVTNPNEPNRQQALSAPSDLVSLLEGTTTDVFQTMVNVYGTHVAMLADQASTTNAYFRFWDFSEQPRLRMNNSTNYGSPDVFSAPWSSWNRGISTANTLISVIEGDGTTITVDAVDVTQSVLAGAYFLRAVSQGYIGMQYDKAYIVGPETDLTTIEFSPYTDVINASVSDLDKAIQIATEAPSSFVYSGITGSANSWSKAEFIDIANSYAAKFLANMPRTLAEANNTDHWNRVNTYAVKGIGGANSSSDLIHFIASSVGPNVFVHNYADWSGYLVTGNAGYIPRDQKMAHLLDPVNQPADYPAAPTVLGPIESVDPRAYYLYYTPNFGFLNASRNRALFTNHWNYRMWAGNNWWEDGYPIPFITGTEMDYIRAEAQVFLGNGNAAAAIMNSTPAGSVPMESFELPIVTLGYEGTTDNVFQASGKTFTGNETLAEWQWEFLKEYTLELDMMGGHGLQWFMMRRHDLLQPGTPLHFAIPGSELELLGLPLYTFGGAGYEAEEGTATGSNSWKTLYSKIPKAAKALGNSALHSSVKKVEVTTGKNTLNTNLGRHN